MYLEHFKLDRKPFENTTDPRFIWFNETYAEAHAALEYGLQEKKGFLLLTGHPGSGKSALVRAFLETVDPSISVAVIPDADMEPVDFFNYLSMELGFEKTFHDKGEFLIFFKNYLRKTILPADGQVLIVIDEAQRATNRLLTDIRLFDSLGADNQTAVTVLLSGQPEIQDLLASPENDSLKSRVALNIRIEPLSEVDTDEYIRHRMDTAGALGRVFSMDAVEAVFKSTAGNPLQINNLCDRALLTAYINEDKLIGPEIVRECALELGISLDSTAEYLQEAIQLEDSAEELGDAKELDGANEAEYAEGSFPRSIKLIAIAAVGVALAILLQLTSIQQSDFKEAADRDQAFSTFESYQQRFENSETSVMDSN